MQFCPALCCVICCSVQLYCTAPHSSASLFGRAARQSRLRSKHSTADSTAHSFNTKGLCVNFSCRRNKKCQPTRPVLPLSLSLFLRPRCHSTCFLPFQTVTSLFHLQPMSERPSSSSTKELECAACCVACLNDMCSGSEQETERDREPEQPSVSPAVLTFVRLDPVKHRVPAANQAGIASLAGGSNPDCRAVGQVQLLSRSAVSVTSLCQLALAILSTSSLEKDKTTHFECGTQNDTKKRALKSCSGYSTTSNGRYSVT